MDSKKNTSEKEDSSTPDSESSSEESSVNDAQETASEGPREAYSRIDYERAEKLKTTLNLKRLSDQ